MRKNVVGLVRTTIISRIVIELVRRLALVRTFRRVRTTIILRIVIELVRTRASVRTFRRVRTTILLRILIGPLLLRIVLFIFVFSHGEGRYGRVDASAAGM